MTRDPNSYIAQSAEHLAETLTKKNADYAPGGEFSNFEKAAELSNIRTLGVMLSQIGIKMTRIQNLSQDVYNSSPQYESLEDSLLDLAGYAIIAHAYLAYIKLADDYTASASIIENREIIRNSFDDQCFHSWVQVGNDVSECDNCSEQRHG